MIDPSVCGLCLKTLVQVRRLATKGHKMHKVLRKIVCAFCASLWHSDFLDKAVCVGQLPRVLTSLNYVLVAFYLGRLVNADFLALHASPVIIP